MKEQAKLNAVVSREMRWFMQTLQDEYGITVVAEEITVEAVELGLDEVDEAFIPVELFEVPPVTLLYEIMLVEDNEGNTWTGSVSFYPNSPHWCLQLVLKNDTVQLRNLLSVLDEN